MTLRMTHVALVAAAVLAVAALWFKTSTYRAVENETKQIERDIEAISRAASLKALWKSPQLASSLTKLRQAGGGAKEWQKKGKTIRATYSSLDLKKVDAVLTRFMRTPVIIEHVEVKHGAQGYDVELVCKSL